MKALGLVACLIAAPAAADTASEFASDAAGSWSSAEQSVDPGYDWVESEVRRIWPAREDGVWLYQENAIIAASPETSVDGDPKAQPYFQVVVHIQDVGGGALHTTTYKVSDRASAKGAWKMPDAFSPDWLGEVSCMGSMQRVGQGFWRGETTCPNSYKGAARVVSLSVRAPDTQVNWDRGFDAAGNHVWGPADGGYVFERKETE